MNKKYLLIKGTAGMGNRLEAVLTGILYAKLSRRTLIVDWSDGIYDRNYTNIFHRFFTLTGIDYVTAVPETVSVYPSKWKNRLQNHVHMLGSQHPACREAFMENLFVRIDYPQTLLVAWSFGQAIDVLRPHFKDEFKRLYLMDCDAVLREVLMEHLHLKEDIQCQVDDFKRKYFTGKTIGIHVRYTDMKVSLSSYDRAIREMIEKNPEAKFFLCTDNRKIISEYIQKYGDLLTRDKWYPTVDGRALFCNKECPDLLQVARDALIEMYLLAACDGLIYARRSTFSTLARVMLETENGDCRDVEKLPQFVSVIIPVLGDRDHHLVRQSLEGLRRQSYSKIDYEVMIIRKDSDAEVEPLLDCSEKVVAVDDEHAGIAELLNRGIASSRGQVLAFLFPGSVPDPNWIKNGCNALRKYPVIGMVTGKMEFPHKNEKRSAAVSLYQDLFFKVWSGWRGANRYEEFIEKYGFESDVNMFVYRHVFEEIGLFDGEIPPMVDLAWRKKFEAKGSYRYIFFYADDACVVSSQKAGSWPEFFERIKNLAHNYRIAGFEKRISMGCLIQELCDPLRIACRIVCENNIHGKIEKLQFVLAFLFAAYSHIGVRIWGQIVRSDRQKSILTNEIIRKPEENYAMSDAP